MGGLGSKDGVILWVLGAAGVLFIYSAYKNQTPQTTLGHYFSPASVVQPIVSTTKTSFVTPANSGGYQVHADPNGVNYLYDSSGSQLGKIPSTYQNSPNSFIPGPVTH